MFECIVEIARIVVVIGMLVVAAVLAGGRNRTPIAFAALKKMLSKESGLKDSREPASLRSRLVAFVLVVAAIVVALC